MSRLVNRALVRAWLRGYRKAVEDAAYTVARHCDCTHADVPGLVRLLADDKTLGVNERDATRDLAKRSGGGTEGGEP